MNKKYSEPELSHTTVCIFEAFCKLANESEYANEITLPKIADKIGHPKQTVYSHYKNSEQVANHIHEYVNHVPLQMLKDFVKDTNQRKNLLPFIADEILPDLFRHHDLLRPFYRGKAYSSWINYVEDKYAPLIEPCLATDSTAPITDADSASRFVVHQALFIIVDWLGSNDPLMPQDFKPTFLKLTSLSPAYLLGSPDSATSEIIN